MAKKSTTPLIDFKREVSTKPITISMRLNTHARLEREVAKGSWSQLIDLAINSYLDNYRKDNGSAQ